ncbi:MULTISPECIES: DUF1382 family protein [Vibrio harveyi group]|uniref:DUF1382 family protein n=1 Tax=Vibrio harveyi group TaxID=717610 RepID=UPI000416D15B|nr:MULTISPECIES: DUF1382 family protein [Vibrio harveyi group]MBT0091335.1 DUF1382 family protein [Vibrio alginolyticus]MCR9538495.1 DUF1382 family protein [Vibrio alginolyticus]
MKKTKQERMAHSVELVEALLEAGIEFVPVPVVSSEDKSMLMKSSVARLEAIQEAIIKEALNAALH